MVHYFEENGIKYLKADSSNLTSLIDQINGSKIENIGINRLWGFTDKSVEFLKQCKNVKRVFIVDSDLSLDGIETLDGLECLISSSSPKKPIELNRFKKLRELRISSNKNWLNVNSCFGLKRLRIDKYKEEDIGAFVNLINLQRLTLSGRKLSGISKLSLFPNLKIFEGYNLSKLVLEKFDSGADSLESLVFENCKNLTDVSSLARFKNLRKLYLINCGKINSLSFVSNLSDLESLRFPFTNVIDGKIENSINNIRDVFFTTKKHFDISYEDFMIRRLT